MTTDPIPFLTAAVETDTTASVSEIRDLLVDALGGVGDPRVDAAGNVRARRGEGGPHLVLNTHVDTVAPHQPCSRDGDVVRGRGACDAGGPLAAMVAAFRDADWSGAGTLTLAVTPDEETLSTGAHALVTGDVVPGGPGDAGASVDPLGAAGPEPTWFVVGEPTGLDVCTAARGRFEGTVTLSGTAAHAASPEAGRNAVAAAGRALPALSTFQNVEAHPELGEPTLVPTGIDGGEATNQVPADCEITFDRRSVPAETAAGFREALATHVRRAVADDERESGAGADGVSVAVDLTPRETPFLEAFATDGDDPVATTLADAAATVAAEHDLPGERGHRRPFGAATEASYFAPTPTVVFGPGDLADDEGAVAHAEREYVRVPEVRAAARALTRAVESLLDDRAGTGPDV